MVAAPRATALLSIALRAMSAPSAVACARTLHVRDLPRGDGEAVKAARAQADRLASSVATVSPRPLGAVRARSRSIAVS
jgi:hypothetical protein